MPALPPYVPPERCGVPLLRVVLACLTPAPSACALRSPCRYEGSYALLHGGPVPKALHLAHTNYLNLSGDPEFQARCLETVDVYGVGLGGARGFYGTTPLHLYYSAGNNP